jgi:hypothetical protein
MANLAGELMLNTSTLNSFQRLSDLDYGSLRAWYYNNAPLIPVEQEPVTWKGDMYTIRYRPEGSAIENKLTDLLRIYESRILRVGPYSLSLIHANDTQVVVQAGRT